MRLRLSLAALAAGLAIAPAAQAKMAVRLSVAPGKPRVGIPARIELRTYLPHVEGGGRVRLEPYAVSSPFPVEAVAPSGQTFRVRLRRSGNPSLWWGSFTFRQPGRWELNVSSFASCYDWAGCGRPRIRFLVRR